MDQIEMKLYKLCSYLSYRLKYESTYLELKYYLDQVLKNKKDSWVNYTTRYDRGIGKTVSVARLSAKYDIPVFVKNNHVINPTNIHDMTIKIILNIFHSPATA